LAKEKSFVIDQLSCLKNPPLDGRSHCLHSNATSTAENEIWKLIHLAYLKNEKNVNICQGNPFGVFWGGNVHNFISMCQLNCILWAYKAKFDCVGFTHVTGFSSWFCILPPICVLMCVTVNYFSSCSLTDNIWNI
jgi:hypothetical protein